MSDNRNTGAPTLVGLLGLFLTGSAIILLAAGTSEAVKADKRRRAINRARANPAGNSGRRISTSGRRNR